MPHFIEQESSWSLLTEFSVTISHAVNLKYNIANHISTEQATSLVQISKHLTKPIKHASQVQDTHSGSHCLPVYRLHWPYMIRNSQLLQCMSSCLLFPAKVHDNDYPSFWLRISSTCSPYAVNGCIVTITGKSSKRKMHYWLCERKQNAEGSVWTAAVKTLQYTFQG